MMLHNILPVSLTLLAAIGAQGERKTTKTLYFFEVKVTHGFSRYRGAIASIRNYAGVARALLGARQSGLIDPSTLPQQCQAPCQPIVAVLNNDVCLVDPPYQTITF